MIVIKHNILTLMLPMLLLMTIGHINVIATTPLTNLTGTVANLNFHKQLTAINQWKYFEDGSGKAQYPNNFEAFWDVTRSNIECGFVIEFLSIRYLPPGDVLEIGFEDYFDTEPKVGPLRFQERSHESPLQNRRNTSRLGLPRSISTVLSRSVRI
jgi:hypothetical protein